MFMGVGRRLRKAYKGQPPHPIPTTPHPQTEEVVSIDLFWCLFMPFLYNGVYYRLLDKSEKKIMLTHMFVRCAEFTLLPHKLDGFN